MDSYNMPNNSYNSYNSYSAQEEKAPNIFAQFVFAFVPPKYRRLAQVKTGSMIGFVTLLVFLFAILSFGKMFLAYKAFGGAEKILDNIPDFSVENGKFSIEETWYLDESETFILVTDQMQAFSYDDVEELRRDGYEQIILVSESGVNVYNKGEYREVAFKDMQDFSFDKSWIENTLVPIIWIVIGVAYLIGSVFGVLWYFACAAIYLLIAMLMALIMGKNIPAGKLFRTAVYSKVLMYVIVKVLGLIPFLVIPIPALARIALTCVFMAFAVWFTADPVRPAGVQ